MMAVEKITIDNFIELSKQIPVIDVRSPAEYLHAHIPGAFNLPLFSDEERKIVGTIYKQKSREEAIKTGLEFFGSGMKMMVEEAEKICANFFKHNDQQKPYRLLVHCWRGGMRSAAIAWLLDLYGFKVYTLIGGYKSFRNYVLTTFARPLSLKILGGYTGSGKTKILQELASAKENVIDLEKIASHKGSAFGDLGMPAQPGQEMFENILALILRNNIMPEQDIWMEDESQRIGQLNIPNDLWMQMRTAPVIFLERSSEERLHTIILEYGAFDKNKLSAAICRIQKKLGGQNTKAALTHLDNDNIRDCFKILLHYYDKLYDKSLSNKALNSTRINRIDISQKDSASVAKKLSASNHYIALHQHE